MILHPDGRVEGTPEEVAAYKRAYADGVEAKLVTEGRIKPTEHNYQILEREARPDYAQQQSDITNDWRTYSSVQNGMQRQVELTEEQVSSLSTHRLFEELSNRTGVNHIPVNGDDVLKLQIANEAKLSVNQREDLFGSKYILIERR